MSAADAGQDSEDELEAKVPKHACIAIHYPGYIANVDKAIETLGGEQLLYNALQDKAGFLKLRLRPEDAASHPLFGERREQQGLVLRIARPKDDPEAEPTITVAARVTASYAFNGLADYQFLGADHAQHSRDVSQLSERNRPAAAEPFKTAQPFLLLPPIFSKQDMPVAYAFRDQPPPKDSELDVSSRKRIVSFYETSLPPELPIPDAASASPELKQQLEKLTELLASRPAWQMELLLHHIPGSTADSLQPALNALCYQFKTGPWKSLFIKCGFDPRASLEGRPYQMVAYRLPTEWSKAVKAAKAAGRPVQQPPLVQLHGFSAMPVLHTTYLQLVDLAESDAAISQLVESAPVPPGPSEAYGWFTYSSNQQLQQAVSMAFNKVYKERLAKLQEQLQDLQQEGGAAAEDGEQQQQAAGAEQMEVDQQAAAAAQQQASQEQQQGSQPDASAPVAAAEEQQQQQRPQEQPLGNLVSGMLGLGGEEDDLQRWLAEEAAAAEERQRRREAAAAAAAAGGSGVVSDDFTDGGESTDAGFSEGDSDWATSGGETTGGEETDDYGLDEYDEYNQDV